MTNSNPASQAEPESLAAFMAGPPSPEAEIDAKAEIDYAAIMKNETADIRPGHERDIIALRARDGKPQGLWNELTTVRSTCEHGVQAVTTEDGSWWYWDGSAWIHHSKIAELLDAWGSRCPFRCYIQALPFGQRLKDLSPVAERAWPGTRLGDFGYDWACKPPPVEHASDEVSEEAATWAKDQAIITALGSGAATVSMLIERTGQPQQRISDALHRLEKQNQVSSKKVPGVRGMFWELSHQSPPITTGAPELPPPASL